MKYKRMVPRVTYRPHDVELPDSVDPGAYQLGPGELLLDEEGTVVAAGPSLDQSLETVQNILSDAQDLLQDVRETHENQ